MSRSTLRVLGWTLAWSALALLIASTCGCSTILRGTHQTVVLVTNPNGQSVFYEGRKVADGESFTIDKHLRDATVTFEGTRGLVHLQLRYDPDPLLIADGALLFLFVVPGLVALGVDFMTGAWRDYHDPQVIYLPNTPPTETTEPPPNPLR